MHEMSLCEGILQILDDNAKSQGFERVKTVWLEVGGLSGVDLDALRFCFDAVTRGSLADNAKLEVIGSATLQATGRVIAGCQLLGIREDHEPYGYPTRPCLQVLFCDMHNNREIVLFSLAT